MGSVSVGEVEYRLPPKPDKHGAMSTNRSIATSLIVVAARTIKHNTI